MESPHDFDAVHWDHEPVWVVPSVWCPAFRRPGPAKAGTPNRRFMESLDDSKSWIGSLNPTLAPPRRGTETMLMSACLWLRGCMGQRTGQPAVRCGFVTRDQPVQKPDDPPRVTGHGLFVGDNDDGVALLRELLEQCHDLDSGLR